MARVELPIVALNTTTGAPVNGASVQVKIRSTGANATWWTQETGGTSSTAAVVTDSAGRTNAWVDRGAYNCIVSGTGITTYTEPFDAAPAGDSTIDALWLPDNVLAARHIPALLITGAKIANDTLTATQIAADAITSSELAANAVVDAKVTAASLTRAKMKMASGSFTEGYSGAPQWAANRTIAHGLGATPTMVVVQPTASTGDGVLGGCNVVSKDGTNIVVRAAAIYSSVAPNFNVTFEWFAWV